MPPVLHDIYSCSVPLRRGRRGFANFSREQWFTSNQLMSTLIQLAFPFPRIARRFGKIYSLISTKDLEDLPFAVLPRRHNNKSLIPKLCRLSRVFYWASLSLLHLEGTGRGRGLQSQGLSISGHGVVPPQGPDAILSRRASTPKRLERAVCLGVESNGAVEGEAIAHPATSAVGGVLQLNLFVRGRGSGD